MSSPSVQEVPATVRGTPSTLHSPGTQSQHTSSYKAPRLYVEFEFRVTHQTVLYPMCWHGLDWHSLMSIWHRAPRYLTIADRPSSISDVLRLPPGRCFRRKGRGCSSPGPAGAAVVVDRDQAIADKEPATAPAVEGDCRVRVVAVRPIQAWVRQALVDVHIAVVALPAWRAGAVVRVDLRSGGTVPQ